MRYIIATVAVPLVLSAGPVLSGTENSATCEDKFQKVSEDWSEEKSNLTETEDVSLSKGDGEVEVTAKDAEPTENWFGKPPDVETVDGYLEAAEIAMKADDEEACLAQLKNVEAAMVPEEKKAADD